MYHLGKVLKIFDANSKEVISVDNSSQAYLEMWDGNKVIVLIHASLKNQLNLADFVLIRYAQPEPIVWRILKQKEGKDLWESMTTYLNKKMQKR